jgi:hypothetical protein
MAGPRDSAQCRGGTRPDAVGGQPSARGRAYELWCVPVGRRRQVPCLCGGGNAATDCGGRKAAASESAHAAGGNGSPSSADRKSSEIAPSRSQIPK